MKYKLYWSRPNNIELRQHSANDSLEWIEETAQTMTSKHPELTYWLYEQTSPNGESLIKTWRNGEILPKEQRYT